MNTIARGVNTMSMPMGTTKKLVSQMYVWVVTSLVLAIFISALSVVYVAAQNRLLFNHWQDLQGATNSIKMQWDQLLVEQNTWATPARIEQVAQQKLNMSVPASNAIVMVNE